MKLFPWLRRSSRDKPRILLLVDRPRWAFDHSARQIAQHLSQDFDFDLRYVIKRPRVHPQDYDLLYIFFWGERIYEKFGFRPERVIKEVSSHRWEDDPLYGPCTPLEFCHNYLDDAGTVICTSLRLRDQVAKWHPQVFHTPNGFDPARFHPLGRREGPMRIGWAGNIRDPVKRFHELVRPACEGRFELRTAPGNLAHKQMNRFYNSVDVFVVSSKHEGEPLTLIEAMAAGCFPVCVDVGIVPELVRHGENGLVVDGSPKAFAEAFQWCQQHLETVRAAGEKNAEWAKRERAWEVTASTFKAAFRGALDFANRPRFRNDDVSADTPLDQFRQFCEIFHRHGLTQIHGVTLHGVTATRYSHAGQPVEYEGNANLSTLPNARIRELGRNRRFAERGDLVDYLNASPDEIALHGLHHTDYSAMTCEEQRGDITAGLEQLRGLFPGKRICYFFAPFNRTNRHTYRVCRELSLTVCAAEGTHLEAELPNLKIQPATWYRYHHHRFYPGSAFNYYPLSLEALERALARNSANSMKG